MTGDGGALRGDDGASDSGLESVAAGAMVAIVVDGGAIKWMQTTYG